MAIDKSKENTRIAKYLAMSTNDLIMLCYINIENPIFLKQLGTFTFNWDYMVAAGLLDWNDVKWIKEHVNQENQQNIEPEGPGR